MVIMVKMIIMVEIIVMVEDSQDRQNRQTDMNTWFSRVLAKGNSCKLFYFIFFHPFFFSFFFIQISQGQCSLTYFNPSPFFSFFLSSYQCSIFSDIFWGLLLLFIVFVCLDGFDVLRHNWPSLFFFKILYQIITRSIFSDIFWPFPLFLYCFLLVIKIQFSPTYWGPSLTFFLLHFLSLLIGLTLSDIIWPSPFFFSFFIQLSQGHCSPTYF